MTKHRRRGSSLSSEKLREDCDKEKSSSTVGGGGGREGQQHYRRLSYKQKTNNKSYYVNPQSKYCIAGNLVSIKFGDIAKNGENLILAKLKFGDCTLAYDVILI